MPFLKFHDKYNEANIFFMLNFIAPQINVIYL